ncbi:MAG: hypothetical protein WBL74_00370 [Novosphingobium sp.]|uniref:hypothetical protein n=1 Tax=Novosphingobium sp. TaxID=1874826 RepID=UPI003C7E8186
MAENQNDGAWFAPKRFGYGSGFPIVWQGWAVLAGHIAVICLGMFLLRAHPLAVVVWGLLIGLLPSPLYAAKTRGGWKWRSGNHE